LLKHKRLVSIIATIAFCLSFLAPAIIAPAPALAAGDIEVLRTPTVSDDSNAALGTVRVTIPAGSVLSGDVVIFELPDDCEFASAVSLGTTEPVPDGVNYVLVPANVATSEANSLANKLDVTYTDTEIRIAAVESQELINEGVFYIYLGDINIDKGVKGDLTATFDGPRTGFPHGDVVVARTSDDSEVTLSASDLQTKNDNFTFTLRIKEDVAGALKDKDDSVILILPDGFEWDDSIEATTALDAVWGDDNFPVTIRVDDDELAIDVEQGDTTSVASAWEIDLGFEVIDESAIDEGDILCKVKGKSNVAPKELKVGTFGDFGVEVTCEEPTEVFAGKIEQEVGTFVIKEIIPNSLIEGRSITLTLPSYAKWTQLGDPDYLTFKGVAGSEGNVLKYEIGDCGSSAAEIEFEDFEVALDVTAPGDLTVEIAGSAGISEEVVIAKIALPVIMTASEVTEVKIGAAAQKIGDLTITETVAGAIADDKDIYLKVPAGCEWAKVPTVTVESGDLKLDLTQARKAKHPAADYGLATTDYYQFIIIPVDRDSNEPSVIKVTDCYVTVDRTVPEGAMTVGLLGSAVLESNGAYKGATLETGYEVGIAGLFPQTAAIAGAAAATVVTPSQGSGVVSFYIDSEVYTVNGVQKFMDVKPYIKADRTYVPVRFLSEALGADVAWDEATKTVTVTKGDKTVVLVIGSTIAKVNGADVQMDVAPEIAGVGRTMLPARWVAEGLGYQVGWIPTVKQVVIQ